MWKKKRPRTLGTFRRAQKARKQFLFRGYLSCMILHRNMFWHQCWNCDWFIIFKLSHSCIQVWICWGIKRPLAATGTSCMAQCTILTEQHFLSHREKKNRAWLVSQDWGIPLGMAWFEWKFMKHGSFLLCTIMTVSWWVILVLFYITFQYLPIFFSICVHIFYCGSILCSFLMTEI